MGFCGLMPPCHSQLKEFNFSAAKTKAIMSVAILFGAVVYVALNTVPSGGYPRGV